MNTNKPLSEWTLGEIKQRCDSCCAIPEDCVGCPARRANGDCAIGEPFEYWDLSELSRWTEQDKQDAANMKRALPLANNISRSTKGDLLVDFKGPEIYPGFFVYYGLFPSLKPGESATLDEIIGDGDQ